jgi:hypothetical protein
MLSGVAKKECAPLAELIGDAMMHLVGREPVHALDLDVHPIDDARAHVVPGEVLAVMVGVGAHRSNEARPSVFLQRKDGKKIARVERSVELAVHRGAARGDVRDVEQMLIRTAWKSNRERLSHRGMRAVAARDVRRLTRFGRAIRSGQSCVHPTRDLLERHQLGRALDVDAGLAQAMDQQPLVLVLRENQCVGKRTDAGAYIPEHGACDVFAGRPEIDCTHWPSSGDDRVRDADLAVQFERACLHSKRA